jgi:hypothetical protein
MVNVIRIPPELVSGLIWYDFTSIDLNSASTSFSPSYRLK